MGKLAFTSVSIPSFSYSLRQTFTSTKRRLSGGVWGNEIRRCPWADECVCSSNEAQSKVNSRSLYDNAELRISFGLPKQPPQRPLTLQMHLPNPRTPADEAPHRVPWRPAPRAQSTAPQHLFPNGKRSSDCSSASVCAWQRPRSLL